MILKEQHRLAHCVSTAILALWLITGSTSARAGELKSLMKDMKSAMGGALGSQTLPEFSNFLARLRLDVDRAYKLPYKADPADYQEGMRVLSLDLDKAAQLAKTGDLAAAKQSLQTANLTKKHYHHLLN
ncbi:cytochrome b562 [Chromobacterium sphagni]|nr:cytochrome b562 [Chromobacterium sphagni]